MSINADLRFAFRLLAASPVFTLTAVVSLACGISATSTIFSMADATLLKQRQGISDPATLVDIGRSDNGAGLNNFGYPLFQRMRDQNRSFDALAAHKLDASPMSMGEGASETVYAGLVSGNYFDVLGTTPAAGRFFLPEEDHTSGTHPVVVLKHSFWRTRFAGNPEVVGQTVRLNNAPYTIVGVAEAGFAGPTLFTADFWVPIAMNAHVLGRSNSLVTAHGAVWMQGLGRLRSGVSPQQAQDDLEHIVRGYLTDHPDSRFVNWGAAVAPSARIPADILGPISGVLGALAILTGLVLLVACTNVAGMLLARGLGRQKELATRLALGATRSRLILQLVVEGVALGLLGALFSVPMTFGLVRVLNSLRPSLPLPLDVNLEVNVPVLAFALAAAFAAAVVFGLLPALQSTRVGALLVLRGTQSSADRRKVWMRQTLVVVQIATAVVMLVCATVLVRSIQRAAAIDMGFRTAGIDLLQIDTQLGGFGSGLQAAQLVETLRERFTTVPGVDAVATSAVIPLRGNGMGLGRLFVPGYQGTDGTDTIPADWSVVSDGYFSVLDIPVVRGRAIDARDRSTPPAVAVVNERLAERVWPGADPIGRVVWHDTGDGPPRALEVVGIARNAKYRSIGEAPRNFIYVPEAQHFVPNVTFLVKRGDRTMLGELRELLTAHAPRVPVLEAQTLEASVAVGLLPQRMAAWVAASVAIVGMGLAGLGLYGLTAFSVSQRAREIGIRMALGSPQRAAMWLILKQSTVLIGVGGTVGLLLGFAASLGLQNLFVALDGFDAPAFVLAAAILSAVMLVAAWVPSKRAVTADPMRSLRLE